MAALALALLALAAGGASGLLAGDDPGRVASVRTFNNSETANASKSRRGRWRHGMANGASDSIPGEPVRDPLPRGLPQARLLRMSQEERLDAILPIAWVHIPKCGSSFGNALIDLPGMCEGIPENVTVNSYEYGEQVLNGFNDHWHIMRNCGPDHFAKWGAHKGMGSEEETTPYQNKSSYSQMWKGHSVGFFREPKQRTISGYIYGRHSYRFRKATVTKDEVENLPMARYAEAVTGCAVKLMTRKGQNNVCGGPMPTQRELERAIVRLREAFVFVGLTDKWQSSICTFHAMFGGRCRKSDFENNRPSDNSVFEQEQREATGQKRDLSKPPSWYNPDNPDGERFPWLDDDWVPPEEEEEGFRPRTMAGSNGSWPGHGWNPFRRHHNHSDNHSETEEEREAREHEEELQQYRELIASLPDMELGPSHWRYDPAEHDLADWEDEYDQPIYEEARRIFLLQRQMYGVTPETCAACLEEAGVDVIPDQW